jgi:hypothetical protein
VDGKRHYGDGLYKRAAEITGLVEQTLRHHASMSDQFELLRRRNNLSFYHHCEVASLKQIAEGTDGKLHLSDEPDKDKIAELLGQAEKHKWSVVELSGRPQFPQAPGTAAGGRGFLRGALRRVEGIRRISSNASYCFRRWFCP